jgi:hypothetical protein
MYKTDVDDDCLGCKYYYHQKEHLTADPYYSRPEYHECDLNWECPTFEPESYDD